MQIRRYKKGEEIETVVLAVDAERERISLGIKQLEKDPFSNYTAEHVKGSVWLMVLSLKLIPVKYAVLQPG